jgi:hypothetical protein
VLVELPKQVAAHFDPARPAGSGQQLSTSVESGIQFSTVADNNHLSDIEAIDCRTDMYVSAGDMRPFGRTPGQRTSRPAQVLVASSTSRDAFAGAKELDRNVNKSTSEK